MTGYFLTAFWLLYLAGRMAGAQLPVRTYTTADGLPSNKVNRIVRDARGYLWFCTREGLSRFDGYQFTNFGVEQGLPMGVNDLVTTESGYYWVATREGLVKFDTTGKGPMFTLFHGADSEADWITNLANDGADGLWCGTAGGLYHFKQQRDPSHHITWSLLPVDIGLRGNLFITSLLRDRSGTIWVGSYHGLFRSVAGRAWKLCNLHLPDSHVTTLLQTRNGHMWIGTWGGLCKASLRDGLDPVIDNQFDRSAGITVVLAMMESSDGTIWIGANGVKKLIPKNDAFDVASVLQSGSVGINGVMNIAEDGAGNMWVASSGVSEIVRGGFKRYGREDGLGSDWVLSLFADKHGQPCLNTKDTKGPGTGRYRINCLADDRFKAVLPRAPSSVTGWGWGCCQLAFQGHDESWWVPAGFALLRYPASGLDELAKTTPKVVCDPCFSGKEEISRAFEDSKGDIWVSAGGRVTVWQSRDHKFRYYQKIESDIFAEDRAGNIWMGDNYNAPTLHRVRGSRLESIMLPKSTGAIHFMYVDRDGRLWLGCGKGLLRIDSPEAESPTSVLYGTADGLSSNDIGGITQDEMGRLYVSTGGGIDCFLAPNPWHITHYTRADGLAEGTTIMSLRDRNGSLWFGNDHGLMRMDPLPEERPQPPPVTINEFKVRGVRHTLSALGETELSGLSLPANQNQLEVGFVGLEFRAGKKLTYQYQLEGAENN